MRKTGCDSVILAGNKLKKTAADMEHINDTGHRSQLSAASQVGNLSYVSSPKKLLSLTAVIHTHTRIFSSCTHHHMQ
jgi:hypothetical protein